jgi:hypothetical protein
MAKKASKKTAKKSAKKTAKTSKKSAKKSSGKSTGQSARKSAGKSAKKRATGKRELIKPNGDARYVRRSASGQFKESDDVGRSLKADRRKKAGKKVKSGYGDRGDR